ncbi:MAG: helix-turn-helix domain-containing protein [Lachnospiraceae bacterium]|nr:helix-turn-helix domain-containing protein [Lachnospiraceae bacterium]
MENYTLLRGEIKKQMTIKGIITYQQLADVSGLARSTVAGFMTGHRYSEAAAKKLCKALGIPEDLAS